MNYLFVLQKKLIFVSAFGIVMFVLVLLVPSSFAQVTPEPQFLVTWKAQSYTPASYEGKALPTSGSLVTVSFELIDKGKIIDLSKQTVYWYIDDLLLRSGQGIQRAAFNITLPTSGSQEITIQLPDYNGQVLNKIIKIPVVRPKAVIQAPYPDFLFSSLAVQLKALPFFFNIQKTTDLLFGWNVNGDTPSNAESPDTLLINLRSLPSSDFGLNIGLNVQNSNNSFESADSSLILNYIPPGQ